MRTVERRLEVNEYDYGSLPTSDSFLHHLTHGEYLVAATSTWSGARLFAMFLQPRLNDLHEDLANYREEADAAIVLAVLAVMFFVDRDDDGFSPCRWYLFCAPNFLGD